MILEQLTYNNRSCLPALKNQELSNKLSVSNKQLLTLPVMESFYTLQGEGFHQGKAAYFIRLAGCNVGCFWCDVKESWDATIHPQKKIEEIIEQTKATISKRLTAESQPIIVVTGGEPLMHNLDELTHKLQVENFKTHIETSGSSVLSGKWDWICLSPKKFKKPLPEIFEKANELKVIIYNRPDFKWAEENYGIFRYL